MNMFNELINYALHQSHRKTKHINVSPITDNPTKRRNSWNRDPVADNLSYKP